jgi:hypothetical protein
LEVKVSSSDKIAEALFDALTEIRRSLDAIEEAYSFRNVECV